MNWTKIIGLMLITIVISVIVSVAVVSIKDKSSKSNAGYSDSSIIKGPGDPEAMTTIDALNASMAALNPDLDAIHEAFQKNPKALPELSANLGKKLEKIQKQYADVFNYSSSSRVSAQCRAAQAGFNAAVENYRRLVLTGASEAAERYAWNQLIYWRGVVANACGQA